MTERPGPSIELNNVSYYFVPCSSFQGKMTKHKVRIYNILGDLVILAVSFLLMTIMKPAGMRVYISSHYPFFILLAFFWVIISLLNGKIEPGRIINMRTLLARVLSSNIISISITALIMYSIREYAFSRAVVLGTALTSTMLELIVGTLYLSFQKATVQEPEATPLTEKELVEWTHPPGMSDVSPNPQFVEQLRKGTTEERAEAIASMINCTDNTKHYIISTGEVFNILSLPEENYSCIINLKAMNSIKKLDDFLDAVNGKLSSYGSFVCSVETLDQRSRRLKSKMPPGTYYLLAPVDFAMKRVLPRLRWTRGIWNVLTNWANPPLSRAEALGRLCRAGFEIRSEKFAGNILCILAKRRSKPLPSNNSGYGMIIALPRVGRGGDIFNAFKLRTMHPYSEFIQDYVYTMHDLQQGGKMKHDFRITPWGRVCRRIWLDELPMIVNLFKGDLKLIGVRPLSKHYFDLYSDDMRARRIKYKPGLIPPFYADMPKNLDEIQISESKYLDEWDKHHLRTDVKYFFRSMMNILFRHARSN
jgi:lipopolysaccharide/colanic/teichoic acid biosynthesis glycosyltransferase